MSTIDDISEDITSVTMRLINRALEIANFSIVDQKKFLDAFEAALIEMNKERSKSRKARKL